MVGSDCRVALILEKELVTSAWQTLGVMEEAFPATGRLPGQAQRLRPRPASVPLGIPQVPQENVDGNRSHLQKCCSDLPNCPGSCNEALSLLGSLHAMWFIGVSCTSARVSGGIIATYSPARLLNLFNSSSIAAFTTLSLSRG